jgi:predicted small lipoprotein YifL
MRRGWLLLALAALTAGGCGQKGPLYLPDKGGKVVTSAPAAPQAQPAPSPGTSPAAPAPASAPAVPTPKPTDRDKDQDQNPPPPR